MRKLLIAIITVNVLFSCNEDDNTMTEIVTEDFEFTVNENPQANQTIGIISATTNQGTLTYQLIEESNQGALSINTNTGELSVENPDLYDFETNEQFTAVVAITNNETTANANITVLITDIFDENTLRLSEIMHFEGPYSAGVPLLFCDNPNNGIIYDENGSFDKIYSGTNNYLNTLQINEHDGTKITEYLKFTADDGTASDYYTLNYSSDNKINNFLFTGFGDGMLYASDNYEVTYNGNTTEIRNLETNESRFMVVNNDGFITKLISGSDTVDLLYDENGNLLSKAFQDGRTITYTYDTKRNPFKDVAFLNWNDVQNIRYCLKFNNYFHKLSYHGIWTSKNNIISIEDSNCDTSPCYEYELQYNSDGYPSERYIVNSDRTLAYTYE